MPSRRSRTRPWEARSGPERFAAMRPPTVVASARGGSSGSHWSPVASVLASAASVQPASTVTVMSPAWWSMTRARRSSPSTTSSRAGGAPPRHRAEVVGPEEERHLRHLLDPDAVLAGEAPAERDARLQDLPSRREHAPDLVLVALVEEEDRVDVAVAGVEDVGDAEPVALRRRGDVPQDVRHAGARHDAVLRAVVGREPADGAEGT